MNSPEIHIPDAAFLEMLPWEKQILYGNLLGAVGDKASELRFEDEVGFGNAWAKVGEREFELLSVSKKKVEEEIRTLSSNYVDSQIRIQLVIGTLSTQVLVCITESVMSFRFLNPEAACIAAEKIIKDFRRTHQPGPRKYEFEEN